MPIRIIKCGEAENVEITALKRQLGRQYREDDPPGAFENPVKALVNRKLIGLYHSIPLLPSLFKYNKFDCF